MRKEEEQKDLTNKLISASKAYYNTGITQMSDKEFDLGVEQLRKMEQETGIIMANSPTVNVGAESVTALETDTHEEPALSLDKVNLTEPDAIAKLKQFAGDDLLVSSWKEDGVTLVISYDNGRLTKAVTRGDGVTGSIVTHNAHYFMGVPLEIPYKGHLVVRGEGTMQQREFERVNALSGGKYENARNLASATIQMLDSNESKKREIWFNAFELVTPGVGTHELVAHPNGTPVSFRSMTDRFNFMRELGFNIVKFTTCTQDGIEQTIKYFEDHLTTDPDNIRNDMPTDGIVFTYEDQTCPNSRFVRGDTGHHPHGWLAMKWKDETHETTIRSVEWQVGRTGVVTPVAVFDDTRMGLGSTVNHATLHNLSIMRQKNIHINAKAEVYMANMIIPAVYSCEDGEEVNIPTVCPVCGAALVNDGTTLKCVNPDCAAQKLGKFVHFCEKDCMNIDGVSESIVSKLIDAGYLKHFADFYHLSEHVKEMEEWEGFGPKAVDNLLSSIEASRKANFVGFIHSLGISNVGKGQAKLLSKHFAGDIDKFLQCGHGDYDFTQIEGFGDTINDSLNKWFVKYMPAASGDVEDTEITDLIKELTFEAPQIQTGDQPLTGKTFVITGSVEHFANRDELKDFIESKGGKTSGSVSKNTTYLINNDVESTSGKNKKAKELGVEIISEEGFLKMV